ncbi:hypothetical protein CXF86_03795 [Shewanella sp. GutCb]|uniref:S41 family peptidase n=3 Tax=unclassified Shewanella TaxID=196818 RepID=UPI000C7B0820|nr:S41 family peptidase [Shewanella sp. GutCb]PKG76036.1 hypothetical protein CXF86_03795 [Shewanella sp. GutCb]
MTVSFKSIVVLFVLMMGISAAQLIRLSFFPHTASYTLSPAQQRQDINQLLAVINQKSSFAAFDPAQKYIFNQQAQRLLSANLQPSNAVNFQVKLQRWISSLNDPATSISLPNRAKQLTDIKQLPGQLYYDGQHWLVYTAENSLFNEEFPFLTHMDGLPMQRWQKAAQRYIPDSIKLSIKEQSHWLHGINQLRLDIGLTTSNSIVLTFTNTEGDNTQREVALVSRNQQQENIQQPTAAAMAASSSSQHVIRYPENIKLSPHILEQLALSKPEQDLILDIRHLNVPDTALTQWLQRQFAPQSVAYSSAIGLMKYKRYPHSSTKLFSTKNIVPIKELHFFEQVNLEALGFDNHIQDSISFSQWLVRRLVNNREENQSKQRKLVLIVDSSCQQECEWLALMASAWPNVQLIGERTRGSLSPRHYASLTQSGIKVSFSAALVYSPQGKLVSGIGIRPTIDLNDLALNHENIRHLITAKSNSPTHASSANALTTAKRSP